MAASIDSVTLNALKACVGDSGWTDDPAALEPYVTEWRGLYHGYTPLLLQPASVGEAAEIIRLCAAHRVAVVPQGGNTGLVGGAIAGLDKQRAEVVLSSRRLNKIRAFDPDNFTVTAEAGVVLADLQTAAADAGLYFPLSLAAEGSCTVGGNISTNAGGTNVLRYGNTRDLVLGLEVVMADGSIWSGLSGLRKDNTGYDLKQLFIGAEGTLGFVTAATLKLFPAARSRSTVWLCVTDPTAAVNLHAAARQQLGDEMVAFEFMPQLAVDMVLEHIAGCRDPLNGATRGWHVLMEFAGAHKQAELDARLLAFLEAGLSSGTVNDGAIAASDAQRDDFWRIRHGISEAQKIAGASIKHDVSVPISRMAEFLSRADELVRQAVPGVRPVPFGHLGDGNLHYNLSQPVGMDSDEFLGHWQALNELVHSLAVDMDGSFSAEHGIGYLKADELQRLTSPLEIELLRRVKHALDPQGIMNPGKLLR